MSRNKNILPKDFGNIEHLSTDLSGMKPNASLSHPVRFDLERNMFVQNVDELMIHGQHEIQMQEMMFRAFINMLDPEFHDVAALQQSLKDRSTPKPPKIDMPMWVSTGSLPMFGKGSLGMDQAYKNCSLNFVTEREDEEFGISDEEFESYMQEIDEILKGEQEHVEEPKSNPYTKPEAK